MTFTTKEAFKKYKLGLDKPIFTAEQLEEAGLKPADRGEGQAHTIKDMERVFFTADQAVKIAGREPKRQEEALIKEIDALIAFITESMISGAPLSNLDDICRRTRKISKKCRKFASSHPMSDAALREELNEKLQKLR
ncbi:MAG: hypothetical protein LBC21_05250, partial [Oscillospiraceae bacterium]|nr:hypothetical protein [Oscillospiraceae bacterium]